MSKLIDLKPWLTLEEGATYLSGEIKEEVAASDLLQLLAEEHIPVNWLMHSKPVEEINHHVSLKIKKQDHQNAYELDSFLPLIER